MQNAQALAPRLGWRLVLTGLLLISTIAAVNLYTSVQGPLESSLAIKQVNDSNEDYVVGTWLARNDVPGIIWAISLVILAIMWILYFVKLYRINKIVSEMTVSDDSQNS